MRQKTDGKARGGLTSPDRSPFGHPAGRAINLQESNHVRTRYGHVRGRQLLISIRIARFNSSYQFIYLFTLTISNDYHLSRYNG